MSRQRVDRPLTEPEKRLLISMFSSERRIDSPKVVSPEAGTRSSGGVS